MSIAVHAFAGDLDPAAQLAVSSEIFETSRMTRWRRARASKSSTFRRSVASA
jgi:hypothetical protein